MMTPEKEISPTAYHAHDHAASESFHERRLGETSEENLSDTAKLLSE
jgi:hypothetical protein